MMNHKRKPVQLIFALLAFLTLTSLACQAFTPRTVSTPQPAVEYVQPVTEFQAPAQALPTLDMGSTAPGDEILVELYARVNPAVVNITIYEKDDQGQVLQSSQGSGFVYDPAGYIVTNAHVVRNAAQVEVIFSDGLIRQAIVAGEDPNSDLAVLQVEDMPAGIPGLPLGSMEGLSVGQSVVAIGNPFGLQNTMTRGVISALGRTIPALTIFSIPQSIQTDAAINPGNSGGPLLNLRGDVIGVNAQIETGDGSRANSGVGFAIPVSIVKRVVPSLIEKGSYIWPYVGVRGNALNYALIKGMNLSVEKGAYIWEVTSNGPAEKAGLRGANKTIDVEGRSVDIGGDVVVAIEGQPIESFDDLLVYVALNTSPGDTVTFTILRDGKQMDIELKLAPRPSSSN